MKNHIVELRYGDYTAKVNVTLGANCISLVNNKLGANILREPDTSAPYNTYLHGMPILYPVNRILTARFEFEGRQYEFPLNEPRTNCHIHGYFHSMEFDIVEQGDSYISCVFEKHYLSFPHLFRMEVSYELGDDGLTQRLKITNHSDENMPNFLGYHTTFNVPFINGSAPEDVRILTDIGEEIERNMAVFLPTGKILEEDEVSRKLRVGEFMPFEQVISRHYKACGDGRIELRDIKNGVKVVYDTDKKFGWRLFYNGEANEYICLEPMTCMANCQNSPFDREYAGFDYIEPHASKEYVSKIYLTNI